MKKFFLVIFSVFLLFIKNTEGKEKKMILELKDGKVEI